MSGTGCKGKGCGGKCVQPPTKPASPPAKPASPPAKPECDGSGGCGGNCDGSGDCGDCDST